MVPGQEQVDQRVLGGLCAGDGDPGGKSGQNSRQHRWLEVTSRSIMMYSFVKLPFLTAGSRRPARS